MTATRILKSPGRVATIALLAALWLLAASLLWRTRVPADLRLAELDPRDYFSAAELRRAARYERFLRVNLVLSLLVQLVVLAALAVRGPRIVRGMGIGRVGSGIVLGMVTLTALWFAGLPFGLAARWWEERHGLSEGTYLDWLLEPWAELLGGVLFALLTIAIVMGLAGRFPRRWWLPGAAAFVGLALLFSFCLPLLEQLDSRPLRDRALARDARLLARELGAEGTPVRVQEVSDLTEQANAFAVGLGPTEGIYLWDTLLDGRFKPGEVRVVVAHEFAHIARDHLWKGIAWFALFALPGAYVIAAVTRRRGGMADPGALPLGLLVLVVLQLVSLPGTNVVSRRYEAEADWLALEATRRPRAAAQLFERFSHTSLGQPNPPRWSYVLFDTHPTLMDRIAMARAWQAAQARRVAGG